MRKYAGPLLLAIVAILAALSTIKYEQNPLVPGRDTGFRLCDASCAFEDSLAFTSELGGDSTRLTLTVSSTQPLRLASYSAYVGTSALGVHPERSLGDTLVVLSITAGAGSDRLFRWPPGAILRLAAYAVDSTSQPAAGAASRKPGTASASTIVRRTPLPLRLMDWRLATSGSADDSSSRARRRDVAQVVYALGLVGLLISAGVAAARAKPEEKSTQTAGSTPPLSVEECINRLIEEIGASGGPDAEKKLLILKGTVQGTMPNEELLRRLGSSPQELFAALLLIAETRSSLVDRVRTLALRLASKAAELEQTRGAGTA